MHCNLIAPQSLASEMKHHHLTLEELDFALREGQFHSLETLLHLNFPNIFMSVRNKDMNGLYFKKFTTKEENV